MNDIIDAVFNGQAQCSCRLCVHGGTNRHHNALARFFIASSFMCIASFTESHCPGSMTYVLGIIVLAVVVLLVTLGPVLLLMWFGTSAKVAGAYGDEENQEVQPRESTRIDKTSSSLEAHFVTRLVPSVSIPH
eukprot:158-Amphidinium_carterae.1